MTVEARRFVVPALVLVAVGLVLRLRFVDLLTKTTGTWIGGVESPHRIRTSSTSTPAAEPSGR